MQRLSGAAIWDESTANRFVVESMPSSAVSPASPSASPASEKEQMTNGGSGQPSSTSFVTLVHGSWCSRTSEDFFQAAEWIQYSQTFPVSGSMRNGQCFQRERLALRTAGSASLSSAWPTARAEDSESCGNHLGATDSLTGMTPSANDETGKQYTRDGGDPNKPRLSLSGQAMLERWPTPDTNPNGRYNTSPGPAGARPTIAYAAMLREARRPGAQVSVSMQARIWQTPNTDSFRSRGGDRKDEMGLDQQSRFWATPQAHDVKNVNSTASDYMGLPKEVAAWPSLTARDWKGGGEAVIRQDGKSRLDQLDWKAESFSRQAQATPDGLTSSENPRGLRLHLGPIHDALTLVLQAGSWAGR